MKNSIGTLNIEEKELGGYSNSFSSFETRVSVETGKVESRLGFVYFVVLVSSLIFLFLR